MSRAAKLFLVTSASLAAAGLTAACGSQQISVPKSQGVIYRGATLFNQRCAGCHTLSYAATHGSAANVHTAQYNNGPNFDVRCERPVTRVLYAIENGGFSGGIMPQNVVVGQEAEDVAKFVATYAGRQSPNVPGVQTCEQKSVGAIPVASTTSVTAPSTTPAAPAKTTPAQAGRAGKRRSAKGKRKR